MKQNNMDYILNRISKEIDIFYAIGDTVFLKTDSDQLERLITGYVIRQGSIMYELSQGSNSSFHYNFEINIDKDILKTSTN